MLYRVKPGNYHGAGKTYGPGDLVELEPGDAAAFLDKLEPVENAAIAEPALDIESITVTLEALPAKVQEALAGWLPEEIQAASDEDLLALDGIGKAALAKIRELYPAEA